MVPTYLPYLLVGGYSYSSIYGTYQRFSCHFFALAIFIPRHEASSEHSRAERSLFSGDRDLDLGPTNYRMHLLIQPPEVSDQLRHHNVAYP